MHIGNIRLPNVFEKGPVTVKMPIWEVLCTNIEKRVIIKEIKQYIIKCPKLTGLREDYGTPAFFMQIIAETIAGSFHRIGTPCVTCYHNFKNITHLNKLITYDICGAFRKCSNITHI